jgi:integrase
MPGATLVEDSRGRSPYWICCYTASDGRRLKRSTKIRIRPHRGEITRNGRQLTASDARQSATEFCLAVQRAEDMARGGSATEGQIRKLLSETLVRVGQLSINSPTIRVYLAQWLDECKGTISARTVPKYARAVTGFLESLGPRADSKLEVISTADFNRFRQSLLDEGRTPQTADGLVRKVLGVPFLRAFKLGLVPHNPLAALKGLKTKVASKSVFSADDVTRLLRVASMQWRGVILFGFYTGARLSDIVSLRWENANLARKTVSFVQGKTGQGIILPLHPELEDYLLQLPSSDSSDARIFPTLSAIAGGGRSGLSMAFKGIMRAAGISAGVAREKIGAKGRNLSALSFHSLRHSFNSELANAGVPSEIRQKLTGHASENMNRYYTHLEHETLLKAINTLPSVGK